MQKSYIWPHANEMFYTGVLRNLPAEFPIKKRMIFEAIGYSFDALRMFMTSVDEILHNIQKRAPLREVNVSPTDQEKSFIFSHIWSIINEIHQIRYFIRSSDIIISDVLNDFLDYTESATFMRNSLQHLSQKWGNFSNASELEPIFGVISFSWFHRGMMDNPGFYNGHIVQFIFASNIHQDFKLSGEQNLKVPTNVPIDDVVIHAFNCHLNLTITMGKAIGVCEEIRELADKELDEFLESTKVNPSQLSSIKNTRPYFLSLKFNAVPVKFMELANPILVDYPDNDKKMFLCTPRVG